MGKTIERTQGDFYHLQVFFLAEKNENTLVQQIWLSTRGLYCRYVNCTCFSVTNRRTERAYFNLLLLIEANT